MLRIVPLICLWLLAGSCWLEPSPNPATPQGRRSPVSVEFYIVHEAFGPDIVERKIETTGEIVLLAQRPDLTDRDIAWAKMLVDRATGRPSVLVHFTPIGTDKLSLLTGQNIGRRLAIVIDGKVLSTPLIRSEIRDGRASIQGFRSAAEARRVADGLARR